MADDRPLQDQVRSGRRDRVVWIVLNGPESDKVRTPEFAMAGRDTGEGRAGFAEGRAAAFRGW